MLNIACPGIHTNEKRKFSKFSDDDNDADCWLLMMSEVTEYFKISFFPFVLFYARNNIDKDTERMLTTRQIDGQSMKAKAKKKSTTEIDAIVHFQK